MVLFRAVSLVAVLLAIVPEAQAYTLRYTNTATKLLTAEQRAVIEKIAATVEADARKAMPELPRAIVLVIDIGRNVTEETGELGSAVSPGVIRWTMDSDRPEGVLAIINNHLRATLFHESHHMVRGWVQSGGEPPTSFMDAVIAEGLATAFARDAGGARVPWAEYSPDEAVRWVTELMMLPSEEAWAQYSQWMNVHPDGRRWIAYRAGTYLIDKAIKASGRSAAELASLPTAELLRLAGYF